MLSRCGCALALLLAGCATSNAPENVCERAIQRLINECGFEIEGAEDLDISCDEATACQASCLESLPCDDIAKVSSELTACTDRCPQP